MEPRELVFHILAMAVAASGCGAHITADIDASGFRHRNHPIFVPHEDPAARAPLGQQWIVTNFSLEDGVPTAMKTGPDFLTEYPLENHDGTKVASRPITRNDLVLEHRVHDGVIWLRSQPMSDPDADKSPQVILRRWLAQIGDRELAVRVREALVITQQDGLIPEPTEVVACELAGKPAAMAVVSLADRGQALIAPEARVSRVALVVVRTGYQWKLWRHVAPAWLLIGYASSTTDFEQGKPDFLRLLGRIQLGDAGESDSSGGASYRSGFHCDAPAAAAPTRHDRRVESEPAPAPASAPPESEQGEPAAGAPTPLAPGPVERD